MVRFFKHAPCLQNHFRYCAAFSLQMQLQKTQTQLRKIGKRSCTAFRKVMCVWTQSSSEEASMSSEETFQFSEEAFRFAPQTQFGTTFRTSASYFLVCTISWPSAETCPPPPVQSFLLAQNLSLKDVTSKAESCTMDSCVYSNQMVKRVVWFGRFAFFNGWQISCSRAREFCDLQGMEVVDYICMYQ